jgi:hypothetical protein
MWFFTNYSPRSQSIIVRFVYSIFYPQLILAAWRVAPATCRPSLFLSGGSLPRAIAIFEEFKLYKFPCGILFLSRPPRPLRTLALATDEPAITLVRAALAIEEPRDEWLRREATPANLPWGRQWNWMKCPRAVYSKPSVSIDTTHFARTKPTPFINWSHLVNTIDCSIDYNTLYSIAHG